MDKEKRVRLGYIKAPSLAAKPGYQRLKVKWARERTGHARETLPLSVKQAA